MKTSLLFMPHGGQRPQRAYLPDEQNGNAFPTAKFWPAHVETGERVIDLMAGKTEPFRRAVPDLVALPHESFQFKRGATDKVRVIPQEYVERLSSLDDQIAALYVQRGDVIAEAWRRGRPLKKGDLQLEKEKGCDNGCQR